MQSTSPTSEHGWLRERLLAMRLGSLRKGHYTRFRDVVVPVHDGTTVQADHVIVSKFGVFVVETRGLRGVISGDENDPMWVQRFFRKSLSFPNTLRENRRRARHLAEYLGLPYDVFHPVVIFTGCSFQKDMPANVFADSGYVEYIRSFHEEVLSPSDVERVGGELRELKKRPASAFTPPIVSAAAEFDPPGPTAAAEKKLRDDLRAALAVAPSRRLVEAPPPEKPPGSLALKLAVAALCLLFLLVVALFALSFYLEMPPATPPPPVVTRPPATPARLRASDVLSAPTPPVLQLDTASLNAPTPPASPTPTPGITVIPLEDEAAERGKVRAFSATVDGMDVRDAAKPPPPTPKPKGNR